MSDVDWKKFRLASLNYCGCLLLLGVFGVGGIAGLLLLL